LHAFIESAFDTGCVVVSDDAAGESGLVFTYNLTDEIFAVDKKGGRAHQVPRRGFTLKKDLNLFK